MDSLSIKKDFQIFENILKKGHPSLYTYVDEEILDSIFETTKDNLSTITSDIELYKKMLVITNQIRDGHLQLFFPNTIKTDQYYFPLILKLINEKFYTDTDDFGIPIGSKINRINGKKASRVFEKLKKYATTDGYNLTRKYREIESKFGLYFAYEYGINKEFIIEYTEPNGISKNSTIPAESFTKVRRRDINRNSYFAKYHKQENNFEFFNTFINNKAPFVFYKKELNTAILVVNSFDGDVGIFKSRITKIFQEINKKKIANLIIDIRHNNGGFRSNAVCLYSFITHNVFKQVKNKYVASLTIPEKKYVTRTFINEKEFLKDKYNNYPIYDGWKVLFDDLEVIMVPHKNRFKGTVYVLTGGATFSAGAIFALNAKNSTNSTLIGEETGGGYYFSNSDLPVYYELPNSKIIMAMYMEKFNHYIKDKTITKGSGIPPDRHITLSIDDLISGKDPELDYVFRLIGG